MKLAVILIFSVLSLGLQAFDDPDCSLSLEGSLNKRRKAVVKEIVESKGYQFFGYAPGTDYVLSVKEFKDKLNASTESGNTYVSSKGKRVYVTLKAFRLNQIVYSNKFEKTSNSMMSFFPSYKKILEDLLKDLPVCR